MRKSKKIIKYDMKVRTILLTVNQVKDILREKSKISSTTHEELLFSIFIAKFYEKINDEKYYIGIPEKASKESIDEINETNEIKLLKKILETCEFKDTTVDFLLVSMAQDLSDRRQRIGQSFQLKRVPWTGVELTKNIFENISKLPRKYSKTDDIIVLFIQGDFNSIDLNQLYEKLKNVKIPFEQVLLLGGKNPYMSIVSIWPYFAISVFDPLLLIARYPEAFLDIMKKHPGEKGVTLKKYIKEQFKK